MPFAPHRSLMMELRAARGRSRMWETIQPSSLPEKDSEKGPSQSPPPRRCTSLQVLIQSYPNISPACCSRFTGRERGAPTGVTGQGGHVPESARSLARVVRQRTVPGARDRIITCKLRRQESTAALRRTRPCRSCSRATPCLGPSASRRMRRRGLLRCTASGSARSARPPVFRRRLA